MLGAREELLGSAKLLELKTPDFLLVDELLRDPMYFLLF